MSGSRRRTLLCIAAGVWLFVTAQAGLAQPVGGSATQNPTPSPRLAPWDSVGSDPVAQAPAQPQQQPMRPTQTPQPTQPRTTPPAPQPTPLAQDTAASPTGLTDSMADLPQASDIPNMMGDFPGRSILRIVYVPQVARRFFPPPDNPNLPPRPPTEQVRLIPVAVRVPAASRTFKIGENESPMPRDRAYFMFNYFNDLYGSINRRVVELGRIDEHRESVGFEQTLFGGWFSVGGRLPYSTYMSNSTLPGVGGTEHVLGDLTLVLKAAPYLDLASQDVISGGIALSVPTAQGVDGPFNNFSVQPYIGWLWTVGDFFFQGFHGVAIPFDNDDVTFAFNSLGVGYFIVRDPTPGAFITGIAPTVEFHVNNPLNHRGAFDFTDPAGTPDWMSITLGTTFQLFRRSMLAVGGNFPVTGPKPYDFEILCQFNWFF